MLVGTKHYITSCYVCAAVSAVLLAIVYAEYACMDLFLSSVVLCSFLYLCTLLLDVNALLLRWITFIRY